MGLVGRNGHGKTTLFKLILGQEEPDSGEITIPRNYRIGHLEQHLHFTQPTILEEAALGLPEEESHSIYKAEAILFGLGFSDAALEKAPHECSGGFQIRINLAKLLLSDPNLLLLDEPTNYLDITSVRWVAARGVSACKPRCNPNQAGTGKPNQVRITLHSVIFTRWLGNNDVVQCCLLRWTALPRSRHSVLRGIFLST